MSFENKEALLGELQQLDTTLQGARAWKLLADIDGLMTQARAARRLDEWQVACEQVVVKVRQAFLHFCHTNDAERAAKLLEAVSHAESAADGNAALSASRFSAFVMSVEQDFGFFAHLPQVCERLVGAYVQLWVKSPDEQTAAAYLDKLIEFERGSMANHAVVAQELKRATDRKSGCSVRRLQQGIMQIMGHGSVGDWVELGAVLGNALQRNHTSTALRMLTLAPQGLLESSHINGVAQRIMNDLHETSRLAVNLLQTYLVCRDKLYGTVHVDVSDVRAISVTFARNDGGSDASDEPSQFEQEAFYVIERIAYEWAIATGTRNCHILLSMTRDGKYGKKTLATKMLTPDIIKDLTLTGEVRSLRGLIQAAHPQLAEVAVNVEKGRLRLYASRSDHGMDPTMRHDVFRAETDRESDDIRALVKQWLLAPGRLAGGVKVHLDFEYASMKWQDSRWVTEEGEHSA